MFNYERYTPRKTNFLQEKIKLELNSHPEETKSQTNTIDSNPLNKIPPTQSENNQKVIHITKSNKKTLRNKRQGKKGIRSTSFKDILIKINMIGNSKTGKSSFVDLVTNSIPLSTEKTKEFDERELNGIFFQNKIMNFDEENICFQVWDNTYTTQTSYFTCYYLRDSLFCIVMCDLSDSNFIGRGD
jgi:hypothetical protein